MSNVNMMSSIKESILCVVLSIVQMPAGIPVATVAIGEAGAKNAALLAAQIIALQDNTILKALTTFRARQTQQSVDSEDDLI